MKNTSNVKQLVFLFLPLLSFTAIAATHPFVTEDLFLDEWENPAIRYTVTNPADSTAGHIVAFAIEMADIPWGGLSYFDAWTPALLFNETEWNQPIDYSSPLTWSQLFGCSIYPFNHPDTVAVAIWYLPFFQDPSGSMQFRFGSSQDGYFYPADPISPGETEDRFVAHLVGVACSTFVLAHVPDINTSVFSIADPLPIFQGEAIPEPATLVLLGLGGLLVRSRKV